ncbi:hypothetical protein DFH07DRAFT_937394 [Mycena maculata]|uniref:Uncharacterized protein n=1 Tax=Mycena maculata TaxID=230809 RepID=A0AAD7NT16_9AGAR|nr:hypothetical protein DFH07DRAFT_937394 [Mycena maculata]
MYRYRPYTHFQAVLVLSPTGLAAKDRYSHADWPKAVTFLNELRGRVWGCCAALLTVFPPPRSMRPLSLHSSALNDAEYNTFTENLGSLLDSDCEDPEAQTLSIREVRAWMRGRYPAVPATTVDKILALFPSKDAIHGGEFFAALRLVLHVESGKDVDRALAFVQGLTCIPVHPDSAVPALPVSAPAASQGAAPTTETTPSRTPQRYNPFLPQTPTLARSKTVPVSSSAPVLPPRKAPAAPSAPIPPPRHPPLPPRSSSPPKPSTPAHITSTLMKQSLQASKTGQWLKQGQARLEQERVLQVLRSTSTTPRPAAATDNDYMSSSSSDGSRSRPAYSIPPSASSLEQVALAAPPPSLQRAFDDAYRDRDTALPPPMHPDRKSAPPSASSRASVSSGGSSSRLRASPERDREREREKPRPPPKPRSLNSASQSPFASPTTQTRLGRSNSLRPSPPPPAPRPGRVRPESVHALLNGLGSLRLAAAESRSPFGDPDPVRREEREGLVARHDTADSISVSDSDSDADEDAEGGWVGVGRFDDSDADGDSPQLGGRHGQGQGRGQTVSQERDSLKWPVNVEGEGWRPL